MTDTSPSGDDIFARLSSNLLDETAEKVSPQFAAELKTLAMENVFSKLWARPGLDARSRSLVTLGILIALRATDELKLHTVLGLNNGLSLIELEEVIYHSTGYAGFPAATAAMIAVTDALRGQGAID